MNKWATALASNPKYFTSKHREYLLEQIAGGELSKLPLYEILRRAETIFDNDYRQTVETQRVEQIRHLREKELNLDAIALSLGLPRARVAGLASILQHKK